MTAAAASAAVVEDRPPLLRRIVSLDLLDNRYPALHGLRVLAIVSVVQYHVTAILRGEVRLPLDRDFVDTSLAIFFGMDLFFILSGFLIGSILIRSFEGARTGARKIRRFYLRRVFRTFPAYYVVLTFLAVTTALTAAQRTHLPYEYAYLTNMFPAERSQLVMLWGWSLALEEQFYLAVPLIFFVLYKLRDDRVRVGVLVAAFLAFFFVRLGIYLDGLPWSDASLYRALYFATYTRADTLVCGIILAIVEHRWASALDRWLEVPHRRAILALAALGCLWLLLRPWMFGQPALHLVRVFAWGTVTSVMYFCALLLLLHGDGPVQRFLSSPFFRKAATLGYGVYLVHIPVCDAVVVPLSKALAAREVPLWALWPACVVVLLGASHLVAYVMHVVIEKPSLWVRDRVAG